MTSLCIVLIVVALLLPTVILLPRSLRDRAARKQRNVFSAWPIRTVPVTELDPSFRTDALGPTLATEVHFIGGAGLLAIPGATSDPEGWVLSVLAKKSRLMFEFGTCTGRTAYLWARNSAPDAKVVTLTLGPEEIRQYRSEAGDADSDVRHAIDESKFASFYYSGTPVDAKVTQLFGDSKTFDETPWVGQCDLVFVDGSHARSYVMSDSRKALRLVKPGGLVLWHDYRGPKPVPGVYQALNELAGELPLVHVRGTSFVAYRRPLTP